MRHPTRLPLPLLFPKELILSKHFPFLHLPCFYLSSHSQKNPFNRSYHSIHKLGSASSDSFANQDFLTPPPAIPSAACPIRFVSCTRFANPVSGAGFRPMMASSLSRGPNHCFHFPPALSNTTLDCGWINWDEAQMKGTSYQ